jgi:glycosyltransferase involved in cell wall biosynthesis
MGRRLKVLLSAYACNPYRGSEDGVGWGWARAAATRHDVHVLTAEFQRQEIERWCAEHPEDGPVPRFHYVPRRAWHYRPTRAWRFVASSPLKPAMNFAYALWLREAHRMAERLHARHRFDLVHLVTYVGFRFPGRYWRMDLPLVWGPIGGIENTPWRLLPLLGLRGAAYYAVRNFINSAQKRLLRGPRRAFRKARGGILAATEGVRSEILRCYGEESEVLCEVGTPPLAVAAPTTRNPGEPLRIAWSGEHLPGKALPLLLRALPGVAADWRLTVLGAGPCTRRWRALARRLGLESRCVWTGWVHRAAALERLRSSHLFVITSLKDLTSTVLLEALGCGLPVVCPNHCGFSDVVTPDCGVKLALASPGRFVRDLTRAIESLAADEGLRQRLAAGALRRSRDFTWDRKAQQLDAVYARVAGCPAVHAELREEHV